jgi:hypothetical protein
MKKKSYEIHEIMRDEIDEGVITNNGPRQHKIVFRAIVANIGIPKIPCSDGRRSWITYWLNAATFPYFTSVNRINIFLPSTPCSSH